MSSAKTLRIQQVRSVIGGTQKQKDALRGLGLRRIRHTVERQDVPSVRGLVAQIPHLVRIVED